MATKTKKQKTCKDMIFHIQTNEPSLSTHNKMAQEWDISHLNQL